jgi:nucleotide-binding universal stress UspA family protein
MKRVLIPVDFSEDSVNAAKYGIQVANRLKADVRLIHVKTGINYAPEFARDEMASRIDGQVTGWMKELKTSVEQDYYVSGGKFDWKIREGNVVREISNQAKYDDTSLIIVASHGVSGFEDKWIGSNAYRLVAHAPCPVIVVRHGVKFNGTIRKIVVPIDFNKASRQKIPIIAGLAKVYGAKIYLVGMKDASLRYVLKRVGAFTRQVERFIRKQTDLDVETRILSGRNLTQQLMDYALQVDADLIAIRIHHSSNPFSNLFRPSTNDIINYSERPVLVVPTKD